MCLWLKKKSCSQEFGGSREAQPVAQEVYGDSQTPMQYVGRIMNKFKLGVKGGSHHGSALMPVLLVSLSGRQCIPTTRVMGKVMIQMIK